MLLLEVISTVRETRSAVERDMDMNGYMYVASRCEDFASSSYILYKDRPLYSLKALLARGIIRESDGAR